MMSAVLGIIGTVLGTVLGWILNNISRKGELKVFVSKWKDKFQCQGKLGEMVPSSSPDQTRLYSFDLNLEIYNSSSETKNMRDIRVVFMNGRSPIKVVTPHDEETRFFNGTLSHVEDVKPINVPPKTIITKRLTNGFWDDVMRAFIWNTTSVVFMYKDEKGKERKTIVHTEDYRNHFSMVNNDQQN